jgi:hypothetical protein
MYWFRPFSLMLVLAAAATGGCAGSGKGLDSNGQPVSGGGTEPLTADFQSIQDNVFTPICTRCHIGASAPEGLQLDEAHSYALLVGVPSVEVPSLMRVKPSDPDNSYMVRKIQGGPGIVGGQMPLGGPPLPQATIDTIRQWIANGAQNSQASPAMVQRQLRPAFDVVTTSPADSAVLSAPISDIVVAFSQEVDASLVNSTTVTVERIASLSLLTPTGPPLTVSLRLAAGNPSAILIHAPRPLEEGTYRVTLRGTGGGALADVNAVPMGTDYYFVFTVEPQR